MKVSYYNHEAIIDVCGKKAEGEKFWKIYRLQQGRTLSVIDIKAKKINGINDMWSTGDHFGWWSVMWMNGCVVFVSKNCMHASACLTEGVNFDLFIKHYSSSLYFFIGISVAVGSLKLFYNV
ncbi:hypothetical protein ACJX0J_027169 [Zea mays]